MLYVDIPTLGDIAAMTAYRGAACVSIYLPTTPITQHAQASRIELKNLGKEALRKLEAAGQGGRQAAEIAEQLDDLIDDDEFWRFQAHSLAVFVTPENVRTFRVANALEALATVSDRFYVKPLLRSVSFHQSCYVLALSQKSVRVIEVSPDLPATTVRIENLPQDAGRAIQGVGQVDYWPSGRIQGAEGQKVLLRQFARNVDNALRPLLTGSDIPLILAAAEPLASIYRSVNTYRGLAAQTIEGSAEGMTDAQLAERARPVLDEIYRSEIADWTRVFEARFNEGRATTDMAQAARAATQGAVDSILVDINERIPGRVNDDGSIVVEGEWGPSNYGVIDEIAARVIAAGGRVIAVRKADIPRQEALAAILRYPA